jgi:hypothetical protein
MENCYQPGFLFLRPLRSKQAEEAGSDNIYYVTLLSDRKKKKYIGWATGFNPCCCSFTTPLYTKEQLDRTKVPKHARRGGKYGHEPVKAIRQEYGRPGPTHNPNTYDQKTINQCKRYGLKIIYV